MGHRHGIHEETYLVVRKVSSLSRGRISYWLLAGLPAARDLPGGEESQQSVSGLDLILAVGRIACMGHELETYLVVRKASGLSRGRISYWLLAGLHAWGMNWRLTWW